MNKGDSMNQNNDDDKTGDSHEPDVVPPDLHSAQQKAQERGRWLRDAIIKGSVSGAVRVILEEGVKHLL